MPNTNAENMAKKVAPSRHMVWYREVSPARERRTPAMSPSRPLTDKPPPQIVPATLPVLFLGTGIFFTLTLIQTHLSHSKSLEESERRISALEDELGELRRDQRRVVEDWGMGECFAVWSERRGKVMCRAKRGMSVGCGLGVFRWTRARVVGRTEGVCETTGTWAPVVRWGTRSGRRSRAMVVPFSGLSRRIGNVSCGGPWDKTKGFICAASVNGPLVVVEQQS